MFPKYLISLKYFSICTNVTTVYLSKVITQLSYENNRFKQKKKVKFSNIVMLI